jgi:hypothetical protein
MTASTAVSSAVAGTTPVDVPAALLARRRRWTEPGLIAILLGTAAVVGAIAGTAPVPAVLLGATALVAIRTLARPELATLAVVGLVYSNAAVVAIHFHGAPEAIQYVIPLILAVPLADRLLRRREAPFAAKVLPLAVAFLAVQILSGLLSRDPGDAMQAVQTSALEGIALVVLLPNAIGTVAGLRRCAWTLVVIGALLGTLSLVQTATGAYGQDFLGFAQPGEQAPPVNDDLFAPAPVHRLGGPIGEKNRYAQVLLLAAPIALVLARREQQARVRAIAIAALLAIVAGVVLTFSRGAALGVIALLFAAVALRELRLRHVLVAVGAATVLAVAVPQYRDRIATITALSTATDRSVNADQTDGSIRSRITENLAALGVFADHPLLGVGPDQFPTYYLVYAERVGIRVKNADREAHNLYLDLAADVGVAGLSAFLALNLAALRTLLRTRRRATDPTVAGLATGLLLSLTGYLVTGLFLHFSFVRYYWLFLAFGATVVSIAERPPPPPWAEPT